jgi:leucyl aminopeptidase (aminopeptidase T)
VTTIVRRCLAVMSGDDVLVIVDDGMRPIGEALRAEAAEAGGDAVLAVMAERETHGTEPPRPIAAALAACDVFVAPTTKSLSHTVARKRASDAGARGATMPGATEDMVARVMAVDFDQMAARSSRLGSVAPGGQTSRSI